MTVLRAALAAAALALAGCSAASGVTNEAVPPASADATAEPSIAPSTDGSGPVRAPSVLGEVEVRPAVPAPAAEVDAPVSIVVDEMGIDMPVEDVGVADDGSMEIPEGGLTAGWYRYGAAPGDPAGNVVLAAHVDNAQGLAPFGLLRDVSEGTGVTVTLASGQELAYVVSRIDQTDKTEVDPAAVFDPDGPPQLVLVTCGGEWDPSIGHYSDNVIITALPTDAVP